MTSQTSRNQKALLAGSVGFCAFAGTKGSKGHGAIMCVCVCVLATASKMSTAAHQLLAPV